MMNRSRFVPRPSFLTGVVGQSQLAVGREGTNRVRWSVSTMLSTKSMFLTYASLPFYVRQEKRLSGQRPLVASYDMPGYSGPILSPDPWSPHTPCLDTEALFYPRALSLLIRHAWDTVDLFYPRALSRPIQHAWDTVDLFYPGPLVSSYDMPGYSGPILSPGP